MVSTLEEDCHDKDFSKKFLVPDDISTSEQVRAFFLGITAMGASLVERFEARLVQGLYRCN